MSGSEGHYSYEKFKGEAASSTPNFTITSRPSIHPIESLSPIKRTSTYEESLKATEQQYEQKHHRSRSQSQITESEDEYCSTQSDLHSSSSLLEASLNRDSNKGTVHSEEDKELSNRNAMGFLIIIISIVCFAFYANSEALASLFSDNKLTIQNLQSNFPLQSEEIWIAIETGIEEVEKLNKPSVFLFLYEEEAEITVNNILSNVSMYAECTLNKNCDIQPIVLTSSNLNSDKAINDYGYIINKYKPELEHRTVMVVKNLDKVSGEVAQAFHSMCDEYTPLVQKTVFFFTIKIDNLRNIEKRNIHIAEEILRSNWSDLGEDIFEPLFTRISSIVLRVVPENL